MSSAETPSSSSKARILAAAEHILETRGSEALTVRSVAVAAGCSTIGVYTHFTDKAGLVEAVIDEGFRDFGSALATAHPQGGRAGLIATAFAYRKWALANRVRYLVMFTPLVAGFEPPAHLVETTSVVLRDHTQRVREAVAAGEVMGDPEIVARHLWATVHGHLMLEFTQAPSPGSRDAEFARAMDWIFDGVSAR